MLVLRVVLERLHRRLCARGADMDMPLGRVLGTGAEGQCAVSDGRRGRVLVCIEVPTQVLSASRIECTERWSSVFWVIL